MNKLKLAALITAIMALIAMPLSAEVRIGVSAAHTIIDTTGEETLKTTSRKNGAGVEETVLIPSIFAEIAGEGGFGIGVDYIPGSADLGSKSRTDDDIETAGDNKAAAEIDGLTTIYAIKTFESGFFLKAGMTQADINTTENLATGTVYGNESVDGTVVGMGFNRSNDNGSFIRIATEYTDFDNVTFNGDLDADSVRNKVTADVDAIAFKLSVGKAF